MHKTTYQLGSAHGYSSVAQQPTAPFASSMPENKQDPQAVQSSRRQSNVWCLIYAWGNNPPDSTTNELSSLKTSCKHANMAQALHTNTKILPPKKKILQNNGPYLHKLNIHSCKYSDVCKTARTILSPSFWLLIRS